MLALIALLAERGPALPHPYSSQVRGKRRERRTHYGREHYRVLYFGAPERVFVLLHALAKRSGELPKADIAMAERRMAKSRQRTTGD